jgi:uncharacterized protein (DUF1778 family)
MSAGVGRRFVCLTNFQKDVQFQCTHLRKSIMPRAAVESNSRVALRICSADKARIMRASALEHTDLTDFIVRNVLRAADAVIETSERVVLSERDSLHFLDLLE